MKYYIHDGTNRKGPFSFDELITRSVSKETLIWREGLEDWSKAESLEELNSLFSTIPPPLKKAEDRALSTPSKLKKIYLVAIVTLFFAWITNPTVDYHQGIASTELNKKLEQLKAEIRPKKKFLKILKEISFALSSGALEEQINQRIWSDDYYVCSLTKVKLKNRDITIGFGAFGNVWLFTEAVDGIDIGDLLD